MNLVKTCILMAALLAATLPNALKAATRTWTGGGGDTKWSTPGNWGGTAPINGDTLVFTGATGAANTNDLLNLSVAGLRFESGGFHLYGNAINFTTSASGLVTNLTGVNTIHLGLSPLQSNKRWEVAAGSELLLAGPNTSTTTSGGIVMLDGGGTVRFTGSTTAVRGIDLTNGTVVVDGAFVDHSNDGFRYKSRAGHVAVARLINNGTWRWGGGANFRLGNSSAAGVNQMFLESGTLELYGAAVSIFVGDTAAVGSSSVFNQNGGSVISTGSGNNDLIMGTASGAESVYNLNGGVLMVRRVRANSLNQGVLNLNGGVLMAKVNDAAFVDGLAAAYIKSGGAIIDSSSNSVSILQSLQEDLTSPGGGLTKLGSGSLTFSNANAYTGPTRLGAGSLGIAAWNYPPGSALVMSNGTTLNLDVNGGGASLASPSVTLDHNTTLSLDYGTLSANPSVPAVSDASTAGTTLAARGTGIVLNVRGSGFAVGQFPLIKYNGTIGGNGYAAFALGSLPPGVMGKLTNNTANGSLDLSVSLVVNALTWQGNVSGGWDINATSNWKDPLGFAAPYREYGATTMVGDIVTFDDSLFDDFVNPPNTDINLTAVLSPAIINVNNNVYPYGFGGAGRLSGQTILNKNGVQTLTVNVANDFTGGSLLTVGTVRLGNDAALGTGTVTVQGGTLTSDGANARTLANPLVLGPGLYGAPVLGGLTEDGQLTFTGGLDFEGNTSVDITVNSDVVIRGYVGNGGLDQKFGPGTLTFSDFTGEMIGATGGNLQIEDGSVVMENGTYIKGIGGLRIMSLVPGGTSSFTVGPLGVLLMEGPGQNIRVGSTSPSGDASATNVLNISGTLSWTTNATSYGQIQMGNSCAFAQVNLNGGGLLRPGTIVHNANVTELNVNGGTLAGTYSTATFLENLTAANLLPGGITVNTEGLLGEPLSLSIGQGFQGVGGLTKDGLGELTLSGTNSYSGLTAVRQGTLILGPLHAATGGVLVTNGAILGLLSDAPNAVSVLDSAVVGDGSTGGGLLAVFAGQSGNPATAGGYITNLTLNGQVPVGVRLSSIAVGTIPLIRYSSLGGSGSVTTGDLPQGVAGTVQINSGTKTIELVVSSVAPLVWTGAGTNLWDVEVASNWSLLGSPAVFKQGDNVRFDDSAENSTVLLGVTLSPGSIVVSNQAAMYSFVAAGGSLAGSASLTKDGSGTLALGGANTFSGDVVVNNGILELTTVGALGATAGATYVNDGATLNMKNIRLAGTAEPIFITGRGYADLGALYSDAGTGNADYLRDLRLTGDAWIGAASGVRFGYNSTLGAVTCVGGLYKFTKVGLGQFDFQQASVTVGAIEVREGILQAANATVISAGSGITVLGGGEFRIYQLDTPLPPDITLSNGLINVTGGASLQNQLNGKITVDTAGTLQVGSGFVLTAANVIKGAGDLIKTSPGLLTLAATNTYTGVTLISNGTLALAFGASIATSPTILVDAGATLDVSVVFPWMLAASQTLSGNGTINGSVLANGTVAPGSSVGALAFTSDLTLAGTTVMELSRELGLTNDVLNVAGTLTAGGTLQLAVAGTTPLQVNDTFDLLNAGFLTGTFTSIVPPAGVTLDTTQLYVDGTVRVTAVAAGQPTLGVVQVGNTLQFSWSGTGYKLQAQTNTVGVGLSNNWADYPGGGSSGVIAPIDNAKGTVFFRLSSE